MENSIEIFQKIEKEYQVEIQLESPDFFKDSSSGTVTLRHNRVHVDERYLKYKSRLLEIVIHEVGHIHCYRHGIYKNYHTLKNSDGDISKMTKKEKRLIRLTALKAEKYVDRWAANEIKKWDNSINYELTYSDPVIQQIFKKEYLSLFK